MEAQESMNQAFFMSDNGLSRYLEKVRNFPMLSEAEEGELSRRWRDQGDEKALCRLAGSHLRLVVKMAMGNRGYGLPVSDLISEGNLGLMQAIEKFDPERGFRLSTYPRWWIRAAIQDNWRRPNLRRPTTRACRLSVTVRAEAGSRSRQADVSAAGLSLPETQSGH